MKTSNQKGKSNKKWLVLGLVTLVAVLFCFGIWLIWMFGTAELAAKCDNGFTIWRRDPGPTSSYLYEIRNGTTLVETGLKTNQLRGVLNDQRCVFLGGG